MKVYSYCVMYKNGEFQSYKNGFFEAEEITSSKMAGEINDNIKKSLNINHDSFVIISLTVIGNVK